MRKGFYLFCYDYFLGDFVWRGLCPDTDQARGLTSTRSLQSLPEEKTTLAGLLAFVLFYTIENQFLLELATGSLRFRLF